MTNQERSAKIKELEELLLECNHFISDGKNEYEKDLEECRSDYEESCRNLESAKRQHEENLTVAAQNNDTQAQIETMTKLDMEEIAHCEETKKKMADFLQKSQEDLQKFPELLQQAKEDKERIESQLSVLKGQQSAKSPLAVIINIVIWAVVILILFKACS